MKTLLPIALLAMLTSCATVYRCGEPRPENFSANKRVTALVDERDSLCTALEHEQQVTADLENRLEETRNEVSDVRNQLKMTQDQYAELQAQSSSDLQAKSRELNEKERMLAEREKTLREMQDIIARQDSITSRLNRVLRDALLGFADDELSVEVKNGLVYVSMSDKLLFKSGSARVESKGKEALESLASVLKSNPDIDILIEGHTDSVPISTANFRDNWDLSVARATAIVRILADDHGVQETRLTAAGRGEFEPRATNETAEGRALNRRTEIILSPKLDELMNLLGQQP